MAAECACPEIGIMSRTLIAFQISNLNTVPHRIGICVLRFFVVGLGGGEEFWLSSIEIRQIRVTRDQILVDVARKIRSRSLINVEEHEQGLHETLSVHETLKILVFQ